MRLIRILAILIIVMSTFSDSLSAQSSSNYIRIAKLVVDSSRLAEYNNALKVHAEAAVRLEPGVIMLYAVSDREHPTVITVFEIYADMAAYLFHIQQPHFLKYKSTVEKMVQSLVLTDVSPIALESKMKLSGKKPKEN